MLIKGMQHFTRYELRSPLGEGKIGILDGRMPLATSYLAAHPIVRFHSLEFFVFNVAAAAAAATAAAACPPLSFHLLLLYQFLWPTAHSAWLSLSSFQHPSLPLQWNQMAMDLARTHEARAIHLFLCFGGREVPMNSGIDRATKKESELDTL
jgi:hypothetical protein